MPSEYAFIYERTRFHRILTVIVSIVVLIALFTFFLYFKAPFQAVSSFPGAHATYYFFEKDIRALNVRGIAYITFLGDLFFNPIPPELFFYAALLKGNSPWLLLIAAFIGFFLANVVNYIIGLRCSLFFMSFMSKKNVYRVRRYVNRYGIYAVFTFNLLPLPSPLLTFALGMARYNRFRLFSALIVGSLLKHLVMIGFYLITR